MPFLDSLDVANRALQHVGVEPIATVDEDSNRNRHTAFAYDKLRRAELRRNVWRFAIRNVVLRAIDSDTLMLVPSAWDATKTYLPGAIVSDSNSQLWFSPTGENLNNTPGDTAAWDMYFGPLTADLWDSTSTYFAGELAYVITGTTPNGYQVYLSLTNANSDTPGTATAYDATVQYKQDDTVSSGGFQWRSLLPVNLNNTPAVGPLAYDSAATYSAAQTVTGSDNYIYSSVAGSNTGHDPVTDAGVHWTNTLVLNAWAKITTPVSSINWLPIAATLANIVTIYPIGAGPSSQSTSRNVFRLPAGYLREAPQDPKAGSNSALGAPTGLAYNDWLFQGDYIVSGETGPIIFRFVADVMDVQKFDDMFCEGLACRVALAVCEPLTQSNTKLQTIASEYKLVMGEARIVNAIETGPEEPPTDDYLSCRG